MICRLVGTVGQQREQSHSQQSTQRVKQRESPADGGRAQEQTLHTSST